ncbi:MAG: protein kinase [Thermoplasmata archaeon]
MEKGDKRSSLQNGRYAILKKLGEGGKGVVYKALDTALDRVVAIKVLKGEGIDEEAYARFMREAQSAARLTHSNIVSTYDIGKEEGRYFLVMEYIDGPSLRGLIEDQSDRGLDIQPLLSIAVDICRALDYAHSKGVLHRDIKPENIMVTKEGTAKLMDFGLARALDKPRVTPSGTMVGTPAYMSPENALGKESDARSDLYSLGAVLYEMATGSPPFQQEDSLKVIYGHIHDTPMAPSRINPDIPEGLEEVILRLLMKDPASRYYSASDVIQALRQVEESVVGREGRQERRPVQREAPTRRRAPTPEPRKALPLIGRENELETLKVFLDSALRGEGSVVFLAGEAGIGKTRLAEELKTYASLRGATWLSGRCFEREGMAPYAPWMEILRDFVREAPPQLLYKVSGDYANDLAKLVPEVTEKIGPVPSVTVGRPDQERLRLFEAVTRLLISLSKESPLALFLDDLNWADPASLELLHYVAQNVPGRFLLILGAYRDVELEESSPLSELLFDLNRERLLNRVSLQRLDAAKVARMIGETFGEAEVSQELRDLIYERTGGNPFFVEEVLRSLVEEGDIFKSGEGWDRKSISEIRIPSSVRAVVRQRLNRLDEECNHVLAVASVIGEEFSFGLLQQVTGIDEDQLLNSLECALKARLIREKQLMPGRSIFIFADSQVRDVLYDELSLIRRRRYHLKTGQTIERYYEDRLERHVGALAYHFVLGNDLKKALEYSIQAGEKASGLHAYEEAMRHFDAALELMEDQESDASLRAQVLEASGNAASYTGQADTALGHWMKALEIFEGLGEMVRLGDIYRKVGYTYFMAKYEGKKALRFYNKAKEVLEREPESAELASLYHDIARLLWRTGENLSTAVAMCEKSLKLAEELGAHEVEALAYETLALLLPTSEKERSFEYLQKALDIGTEHDCFDATSRAFVHVGVAYATIKGDSQKAIEAYLDGMDYVRKVGYPAYRECIQAGLALEGYLPEGSWEKAVELADSLQGSPVKCMLHGVVYPLVTLGLVSLYQGKWAESEEYLKAALLNAEDFGEASFVTPYVSLGGLYMEKGEYDEAEKHLKTAYDISKKAGDHIDYVTQLVLPLSLLAELALRTEKAGRATEYLDELAEIVDGIDEEWAYAYSDRAQGLFASHQNDWDAAGELFQKSIQKWRKAGRTYELGRTLYELGVMHQQKGDREGASEPLNQALEIFTGLGAKMDIERVLARKELLKA